MIQPAVIISVFVLSVLLHLSMLMTLDFNKSPKKRNAPPVKIKIVKNEKKIVPPVKKKSIIPPKIKPKPKPKPKKIKKKKIRSLKKIKKSTKPQTPVAGLNKNSFSKNSKSKLSVPAGNTLLMKDDGKRVDLDKIEEFGGDLSIDAQLVHKSFHLQYTEEAEDAEIEGAVYVDVFVSKLGNVEDVDIDKKIGFGMDKNIIKALNLAYFRPRRNKVGVAISGWVRIKIILRLD